MNYPIWQLDAFGGGLLIAIIAIIHVYISHFAVGGGLFLVLTEMKGLREGSAEILAYTKRHTKFFLLLTMVLGGMTGVGIWFTIALISPAATSSLIHIFVFAWAIEWVFFLAEIIALLFYYYTFGRLSPRKHLILGWIYFGCAWASLFFINGIIDFMLTPGEWLNNNNFWSGFFNPTFWPALFFRTFMAVMIAGLFGFLTSVNIKEATLRHKMVRYCGLWLLTPVILLLASALWYKAALPPAQQEMIFTRLPGMQPFLTLFIWLTPLITAGGLAMAVLRPQAIRRPLTWLLLLLGFLYLGSFEFIREKGRKPYIIHDYMYSTSIRTTELGQIQETGVLASARWVKNKTITPENRMAAGRELFNLLCLPCHSDGGPLNDILPLARRFSPAGMRSFLASMGTANPYMPPFAGNEEELGVLADYLTTRLVPGIADSPVHISKEIIVPPPFDRETAGYLLLASTDRGMILSSEPEQSGIDFSFGPPTLRAQVIQRGETPAVLSEDIEVSYRIDNDHGPLLGNMVATDNTFEATLSKIPAVSQDFRPYLLAEIEAVQGGRVIAATRLKIGISTEIGCRNCHGGPWGQQGRTGLSRQTAANILAVHDQRSKTRLGDDLAAGRIVVCRDCHADHSRGAAGQADRLNLSAAMHGFHAAYLYKNSNSCTFCHAGSDHGTTGSPEDLHTRLGLACSDCHGSLADHAISLLKEEQEAKKPGSNKLLTLLADHGTLPVESIKGRVPWTMEPDCLTCHVGFQPPETATAFNSWTADKKGLFAHRFGDEGVLLCASCHGAQHTLYPADNAHSTEAGNLQPLQYQNSPYPIGADRGCAVCHTVAMDEELHHPGSLGTFRNRLE
ncbi:MAG: cytochrome ubiquinol oxidase subunit I [Desulfoarculaceae bacterium]|nr:cytochrome ubiquinol oxidase subunit I [Desulfoarculaceae bacterium]